MLNTGTVLRAFLIVILTNISLIGCDNDGSDPETSNPTTPDPTTSNPTTPDPTTSNPTTPDPTTSNPTTPDPTTSNPTTPDPAVSSNWDQMEWGKGTWDN